MPGALGPALFAVASFFLLWPFARLDFDRHHDGYMLAQAIAVHQGAAVHSEVFAQYGPVTPWLQSLALFLPMSPALALRTVNVAFIAVTVFLLADMGRNKPRGWPVTRAAGWWAAIAWVVLASVWLGLPMLPWSSTLAAMLSLLSLYFLTRSMRCADDGSVRASSATAVAAGLSLGLMPFTRINVGLSAMAVCFVVAGLMLIVERGVKRKLAALFILGAMLSVLSVVGILAHTSALADFYYQSIEWPWKWGGSMTGTLPPLTFLALLFAKQALLVALVFAALFVQIWARSEQRGWSVRQSGANVLTVLVGLIIVAVANMRPAATTPLQSWGRPVTSYLYLSMPNAEYLYFFMVLSVVAAAVGCAVLTIGCVFGGRPRGPLIPWLLLGGLALSGLTQIFPTWDPRHVWWGLPIGLLLSCSLMGSRVDLNRWLANPLMLPLILTTVMAILSGSIYWRSDRIEGQPGTVIEGMLVSRAVFDQVNQDTTLLGAYLGGSRSVVYLVNDGDLSVLDGQYRSADSYFVEWGGSRPVEARIRNGPPIVVQTSHLGMVRINSLARSIKYDVVARNQRLVVLMPVDATAR